MPIKRRGEGDDIEIATSWEDLVERKIREAQEEGQFDNLAGIGKPQDLSDNPYAGDWQMAFKILKDAGAAPPWIETDKEVRQQEEATRRILKSSQSFLASWREKAACCRGKSLSPTATRRYTESRERYRRQYVEHLAKLNALIDELNFLCPMPWLRRGKAPIERELEKFDRNFPPL